MNIMLVKTKTLITLLTLTLLMTIISSIVISTIYYRRSKVNWLSTKKITIMSTFLAIFMIQAFVFQPLLDLPIKFSFDSITTIAVGFMFGPLEGILFGWVADTLRVLINGWSYQLLPSLMYPMIGLIAALFGILYRRSKEITINTSAIIFQITILSLFIVSLPLNYFLTEVVAGTNSSLGINSGVPTLLISIVMLIMVEIMFIALWFGNFDKRDIILLTILLLTAYCDRIMELVIRPFTQYYAGYEASYIAALYTRLVSSTLSIHSTAVPVLLSIWPEVPTLSDVSFIPSINLPVPMTCKFWLWDFNFMIFSSF